MTEGAKSGGGGGVYPTSAKPTTTKESKEGEVDCTSNTNFKGEFVLWATEVQGQHPRAMLPTFNLAPEAPACLYLYPLLKGDGNEIQFSRIRV